MREAPFHHLVKKYSNRKLYDTHTRRYITLDDIARLVREGRDVTVVQRDTGEDLTPAILSQIVAREERRGPANGHADVSDGIQERGQALLDYLRRTINMPAEIVTGEVERRVGDMEALVDSALERALKRLNIPSRRDIVRLNARLDAIDSRLGRSSAPAAKRTATRRPRKAATAKARTRRGAA